MRTKRSFIRPTVRWRKAKGSRKTVKSFVLVLKGEPIPRKSSLLRAFPRVSYGRAETAVERENAEREHESATRISAGLKREGETGRKRTHEQEHKQNATTVSAGLKERAKTVERGRKKHATQGGEARGVASRGSNRTKTRQPVCVEAGVDQRIRENTNNRTPTKYVIDKNAKTPIPQRTQPQ